MNMRPFLRFVEWLRDGVTRLYHDVVLRLRERPRAPKSESPAPHEQSPGGRDVEGDLHLQALNELKKAHTESDGQTLAKQEMAPANQWSAVQMESWIVPRWQDNRPVIVGVDFGTHSTKVVVRTRGEHKATVFVVDEPAPGYPSFVSPSLVRLVDGRLTFGRRAFDGADGALFQWLKIALLPPTSTEGWLQEDFPLGITPDLLVAAYLAWILGRVKTILGGHDATRISLNVAAPMDHLENGAMKERYLHVVHAAWQASFGENPIRVENGVELAHLRPFFEDRLGRSVPDRTVRRFEILPETLAPLVSLSQDPRVKAGLYMMVDMGAGTTEFSVSHVNERDVNHRVLCYADASILLGGKQFTENDMENAAGNERLSGEEQLKQKLLGNMKSVWYGGFQKDMNGGRSLKNRWKQLNVVLSGGGLRRKGLQGCIEKKPPMKFIFGNDALDYDVMWHRPADLDFLGAVPATGADDDPLALAYLAVAHGLSLERQKWPTWSPPKDVERSAREERAADPLVYGYMEW